MAKMENREPEARKGKGKEKYDLVREKIRPIFPATAEIPDGG